MTLQAGEIPCNKLKRGITSCNPYVLQKNSDNIALPKSSKHPNITTKIFLLDLNSTDNQTIKRNKQKRVTYITYPTKFNDVSIATKDDLGEFQQSDDEIANIYDNIAAIDGNISGNEYDNIEAIAEKQIANEYDNIAAIEPNDADLVPAIPKEKQNDPDYMPALPRDENITNDTVPEHGIYIVKTGDTLSKIAKRFIVKSADIAQINKLGEKQIVWVGQKLKIPGTQERVDNINNASYVVKKGDSLIKISKVYDVNLSLLKKYNKLPKGLMLHVGQKLMLPLPHKLAQIKEAQEKKRLLELKKKREAQKKARIARLKKEREKAKKARIAALLKKRREAARIARLKKKKTKSKKPKGKFKRKLRVTATAYISSRSETDSTPFLAAWSNRIRPGMKIIAVSNDLIREFGITNGSKVRISGLSGVYTVRDKMNKKWRRRIDIYMGLNAARSRRWGKRRVVLFY